MTPQELQALLDREGVPMEARAPLRIADTGAWWETECPGSRGTYIDDDLAELAHVGAMVRWLESKVAGGIEIKSLAHEGGEVFFHVIFSIGWDEQDCKAPTLVEALAHACGRIAKEKA